MAKIAVITIHGMGNITAHYADPLRAKLQDALASQWANISFQSVYYQNLLQPRQQDLFDRMKRHLSWIELREFLLFGCSDAIHLEASRKEADGLYVQAQLRVAEALQRAYSELDDKSGKVIILAQSLGGQVISNYLWDAQHAGTTGIWKNIDQYLKLNNLEQSFVRLNSLHRLFTTGCTIPLSVAGTEPLEPIAPPNPAFRWFNFYDADDALGYPLQPLSPAYETLVEDIPVNVDPKGLAGLLSQWNPLSHTHYWEDRGVLETVIGEIGRSL
ncbi:MAG: hypothetical protein MUF49_09395 [Oculatellaceae cyanobacterium Prado106]|jgi:hypothetical protein|nr:hypothetical protein [Oculatellaceae cyanobacterium Prado106]